MTAYTVTLPLASTSGKPSTGHNEPYFMSVVIDFSSQTNAASDTFAALTIPAKTMVLNAGIDILTVNSLGSNDSELALGGGATYVTAATYNSSTGAMTSGNAVGEMFVTYDAADTLDVTVTVSEGNGVIRVWAIFCDTSDPITAQRVTIA